MKFRLLFIGLYGLAAGLALQAAFLMRFYFDPLPFRYDQMLQLTLPLSIICKAAAAEIFGLTRSLWRYASFRDLKGVILAAGSGGILFAALAYTVTAGGMPNGVLLLDMLLTLGLFTAVRFSGRFWEEARQLRRGNGMQPALRVLVLGADKRGQMALRFLQEGSLSPVNVVGFLDEESENAGRRLLGVPILGQLRDLPRILEEKRIQEVVISESGPGPEKLREIFSTASARGCRVSLLPDFTPGTGSGVHRNPIRELKMSDFLGREAVRLDPAPLEEALGGQTVLVTGAGGSIGSELCRQIAALPVEKLVLLDFSETALFEISEEIGGRAAGGRGQGAGSRGAGVRFKILLCDIRFPEDLQAVFEKVRPDVVFHAAAYKHVPMMELHPMEAARTNILGTRNVVECAKKSGVKRLLHVSTDKAVEAEGVMGASKAWGERIVRAAGYSCVRFGNVLGSSGSVIPLFEKQWTRQGVLQVTHPEATRYFMTIEEAVQLMLHAEALQGSGNVYILDMGEPVKIMDLAKQMVELRTRNAIDCSPENDPATSPIRIVGLRPGERIHERLHTPEEQLEPTSVPKVNRLSGRVDLSGFAERLDALEQAVAHRDPEKIRDQLLRGE